MATKAKSTSKTFTVCAKVSAELMVEVLASDWDSALSQAKELEFSNFSAPLGEVNEFYTQIDQYLDQVQVKETYVLQIDTQSI